MLFAEPLLSQSAPVTGGLVQQDKESNSWKMQDRNNQSPLVTGQGMVMSAHEAGAEEALSAGPLGSVSALIRRGQCGKKWENFD